MGDPQTFRANVGVVVVNSAGLVLALERNERPGAWQLPQGGLDEGEEPTDAALRELVEETGLRSDQVELLGEHPRWLAYELPVEARSKRTGRGQVQKWFLFRLIDPDTTIDLDSAEDDEFGAYEWITLRELAERTWVVRRCVYQQLADHFAEYLAP